MVSVQDDLTFGYGWYIFENMDELPLFKRLDRETLEGFSKEVRGLFMLQLGRLGSYLL